MSNGRHGSCGSCAFSTTLPSGIMLCCIDPPSWQRSISYAGSPPPPTGSEIHALDMNWPVVRSTDWCSQGIDATTSLPFTAAMPSFTTVAKLPEPTPAIAGARTFITDAVSTHAVGTALTGGGTITMPVYCTGTAWLAG